MHTNRKWHLVGELVWTFYIWQTIEVEIVHWILFDITLLNEGNIGHKSEDSLWDTNILDLKVESEVYNLKKRGKKRKKEKNIKLH